MPKLEKEVYSLEEGLSFVTKNNEAACDIESGGVIFTITNDFKTPFDIEKEKTFIVPSMEID